MRNVVETAVVGVWAAGMLCLALALVKTRLSWRSDVPTSKFWTSGSDLAVHPERYVFPHRAAGVRALRTTGAALILLAVLGLVGAAIARWLS